MCVFVGGDHVLVAGGITFCEEVCHSGRRHDLVEEGVSFTEEVNLSESRCVLWKQAFPSGRRRCVLEGEGVSFPNRCVLMGMGVSL